MHESFAKALRSVAPRAALLVSLGALGAPVASCGSDGPRSRPPPAVGGGLGPGGSAGEAGDGEGGSGSGFGGESGQADAGEGAGGGTAGTGGSSTGGSSTGGASAGGASAASSGTSGSPGVGGSARAGSGGDSGAGAGVAGTGGTGLAGANGEAGEAGAAGELGGSGDGGQAGQGGEPPEFIPPLFPRTTGAQRTLVILLSADPMPGVGPENPPSIVNITGRVDRVDTQLRQLSYGRAWLDPVTVVGVYSGLVTGCEAPFASGNSTAIISYALARADPDVDFRSVDQIFIMMSRELLSTCEMNPSASFWPELPSADGPFTAGIVLRPNLEFGSTLPQAYAIETHELLHTLGASHVMRLTCYDGPARTGRLPFTYAPGVRSEFPAEDVCPTINDVSPIDIMGSAYVDEPHLNAAFKRQLGWLDPKNVVTTRSGTYTLRPLDASTAQGTVMIEVPIPYTTGAYVLEYRAEGSDPGVYLHLALYLRPPVVLTWLLSTDPYSEPFSAPLPLRAGPTLVDPLMDLRVNVISADATGATISITSDPSYVTQCTDGIWNGSGFGYDTFDEADYSCQSGTGLSEIDPAPTCFNGIDDDGDGLTDERDPSCAPGGLFLHQSNQE